MESDNDEIFMFKTKYFFRVSIAQSNGGWPILMYDTLFIHTETKKKSQVQKCDIGIILLSFERNVILVYHTATGE